LIFCFAPFDSLRPLREIRPAGTISFSPLFPVITNSRMFNGGFKFEVQQ
jgi:hypothetical protein